jgi:hypothetical protein
MIDLQREASFSAVDTLTAPLLQQVFPDFVSGQRPLLVLDSADLRVLHQLGIKPDRFEVDGLIGASLP